MASIIITPGPDTLLVMRNSANSGRGVGFATVLGVQVGLVFHTLLALVGVTAILAANTALILLLGLGAGCSLRIWPGRPGRRGLWAAQSHRRANQRTPICRCLNDQRPQSQSDSGLLCPHATAHIFGFATGAADFTDVSGGAGDEHPLAGQPGDWRPLVFSVLSNPNAQRWINRLVALILLALAMLLPFQAVDKALSIGEAIKDKQPAFLPTNIRIIRKLIAIEPAWQIRALPMACAVAKHLPRIFDLDDQCGGNMKAEG